tara:strand:- start:7536 stop:8465 length:930 start_codon:yes stop_codon:yes gene_type:complete
MKIISKIWSDRSAKTLFIFLIFIALVSTFLLIRSVIKQKEIENNFQQTKTDNNTSELQNSLRNDLDDLQEQYESLLDEYGNVNLELQYQDSIIRSKINEVKQLLRRNDLLANDLKVAKEKIISLQNIAKRYVYEIDSLANENKNLVIIKDSVIAQNRNINWKNYTLNKENEILSEKVSVGSILKVISADITALKYTNRGKEKITKYAKNVQNIRVCFTIGANLISNSENKIVYMQLINSSGEIIESIEDQIIVDDTATKITTSSSFDYNNNEMEHCFDWQRTQPLTKDTYLVNLILEGRVSKQLKIKLR